MVVRSKEAISADNQDGQTLLRRLAAPDFAGLCARGRDAGAVSAAVPGQFGLCGESSWPTNWHGEDGARSASSRMQAKFTEPIREQLRDWLRQQPDFTLAELQEKLGQAKPLRGECSLAVGGAGQDGIAVEKKSLHARERDTEVNRQRRAAFLETLRTLAPERLICTTNRATLHRH